MTSRIAFPSALFLLLTALPAAAQVPHLLGFQGRLLRADGTAATGTASVGFGLFDAETGGSAVWQETQTLGLSDGYYATFLGLATALPDGAFDGARWLEFRVGSETLAPRQRVGAASFALTAQSVRGGSADVSSLKIGGQTVVDAAGRLAGNARYAAGAGLTLDAPSQTFSLQTCPAGQALVRDATSWQCAAPGTVTAVTAAAPLLATGSTQPQISLPQAGSGSSGYLSSTDWGTFNTKFGALTQCGGDLAGNLATPTVARLQSRPMSPAAPTTGQVLKWTGAQWEPAADADSLGTVTALTGVAPLTVWNGSTTPQVSMAASNAATDGYLSSADWFRFDSKYGSATECGGDLSGALAAPLVVKLQGIPVVTTVPGAAQVLRFDGSRWAPASLEFADVGGVLPVASGGTGIAAAPTAAGQFLRSPAAGAWGVGALQSGDVTDALGYVPLDRAGGTLAADPAGAMQPATKQYVDGKFASGVTDFNSRTGAVSLTSGDVTGALAFTPVNRAGDTLSGALVLAADPASAMQAATKQYVDASFASGATSFNGRTGAVSLTSGDVTGALTYAPVNRAGDTLSGALTLAADPASAMQAATKQYVDGKFASGTTSFNGRAGAVSLSSSDVTGALTFTPASRAGDTLTGPLTLPGNPTAALHAAPKQYVDSAITTALGGLSSLSVTGNGLFGSVSLSPTSAAPPTCDSTTAGRIFFDSLGKAFYGCDGTRWTAFAGVGSYYGAFAMLGAGGFTPGSTAFAVSWTKLASASGISVSGTDITFGSTGVYEISVGARISGTNDIWQAWALYKGGTMIAQSHGFGAISASDQGQQAGTFLASVDSTTSPYQIVLLKANTSGSVADSQWADSTGCRAVIRYAGRLQAYGMFGAGSYSNSGNTTVVPLGKSFNSVGITRSGSNLRFPFTGPYVISAGARVQSTGDVWQAWALYKGATFVAQSNGFGAMNSGDAGSQPGTFIANVDSISSDYQLVFRQAGTVGGVADSQWGDSSGFRAVVRAVDTSQPYAMYGAAGWSIGSPTTTVPLGNTFVESGIARTGSNLRFSQTGTYQITAGSRMAGTGDVWMAWALYKGATLVAQSNGFGDVGASDPGQQLGTFLAQVDSTADDYQIVLRKASGTGSADATTWGDYSTTRVVIERLAQ